tara:strand:+ start:297 stop:1502 length:1206 start_codon:yes stop_codon:yes gene_type:complete
VPAYRFRALDGAGAIVRGSLEAASEPDLETRLRGMRLELVSCVRRPAATALPILRHGVSTAELIQFCIHMAQLDRAGVPLLDALADIAEATPSARLRGVLRQVRDDVHDGALLSAALARHPGMFDAVFTGIVAAGEETGDLGQSFARLETHLKWVRDVTVKVGRALRYPAMLLIALAAVIAVMMGYLVPRLVEFLVLQQVELPPVTRALIGASDFLADYGWLVGAGVAALAVAVYATTVVSQPFARLIDRWKLRLPVIGTARRKIALARFTHFFAIMFGSGIDVLRCLRTSERVVANRALQAALADVRHEVENGLPLSQALADSGAFPPLVVRMFRVGEESGRLDEALENVAYFYDREVDESVGRLVGVIEPAMTAVIGLMLLWIVLAVFGPLYDNLSQFG